MAFKPHDKNHPMVKKAKAKQLAKLKADIAVRSGLAPGPSEKRRSLGLSPQVGPQLEMLLAKWCPEIFFGGARGGGKANNINHLALTDKGLVKLGDIRVGDKVYDRFGKLVDVLWTSGTFIPEKCYELEFDNGQKIETCSEHLWVTYNKSEYVRDYKRSPEYRAKRRSKRPSRAKADSKKPWVSQVVARLNKERQYDVLSPEGPSVKTTQQIVDTLKVQSGREVNHRIPLTEPLEVEARQYKLDPYLLGLWLGDGTHSSGFFATMDMELVEAWRSAGFEVTDSKPECVWYVKGLVSLIREMGLFKDKRVPDEYLLGSKEQRLALLQGLMDTDGTCDIDGGAVFYQKRKHIADAVVFLAASLGLKPYVTSKKAKLNDKDYGICYCVKITTNKFPLFRLKRKVERQKTTSRPTQNYHYIIGAKEIAPIPMCCIGVNGSNTYLLENCLIPTHNSIALLLDFLQDCGKGYGNGWRGVIFRRTYPQLKQLIEDSHRIYGKVPGAAYFKKEREWIFPGGEKLEFRFLENASDITNYQGHAYQWMGYDELPNWPDLDAYDLMKASLRPTSAAVPCRIRSTGNPGGIGHGIVKQRFIDPYGDGVKGWRVLEDDGKGERMFIPSSVWDNQILLKNDPNYIKRLEQSGPDHLVKAWLYGEWDLVLGAFFDCWSENNIRPMGQIPEHWFRFRSFDWGGHAPFCVHWWAVSDGITPIMGRDENYVLPAGAKICYREWYGCDDKDYKKGLSLDNEEMARGILKRTERNELVSFTVTDNLPFQRRGGPTIAEVFAKEGVPLTQGDTDRISGCSAMYMALKGGESRVPMMYFMEHCKHAIRQIPTAQKDEKLIEAYEQTNDDHALDSVKISAKIREYYVKPMTALPDESERLHNSIIERPTWQQIMSTHFTKVKQSRDPYGL